MLADQSFKYHLLVHDHDRLWTRVVGGQTLDQFWVVKKVHELDLFARRRSIFGGSDSVELPGTHLAGLFVDQAVHLAKLSTRNMM